MRRCVWGHVWGRVWGRVWWLSAGRVWQRRVRQCDRTRRRSERLTRGSRERAKYLFATHRAASEAHLAAHRLLATHSAASKTLFAANRFLAAHRFFAARRGTRLSAGGGTAQVWRNLATRAARSAARRGRTTARATAGAAGGRRGHALARCGAGAQQCCGYSRAGAADLTRDIFSMNISNCIVLGLDWDLDYGFT